MLIGLWVWDELSFNTYHRHYDCIAQVWGGSTDEQSGVIGGAYDLQYPVGKTLRENYPGQFKPVSMAYEAGDCTLCAGDKKLRRNGQVMEAPALEMLSLRMVQGNSRSLQDPYALVLSQSTARAITIVLQDFTVVSCNTSFQYFFQPAALVFRPPVRFPASAQ